MSHTIYTAVICRWSARKSDKAPAKEPGWLAEYMVIHFPVEAATADATEQQKQAILAYAQRDGNQKERRPEERDAILAASFVGTFTAHIVAATKPFDAPLLPTTSVR